MPITQPARLIPILLCATATIAPAQRAPARPAQPAPSSTTAYDPRLYSDPAATSNRFKALHWRNVGPFRGGRVDAVTGDPTRPLVFYMGAVNGGVWKTTNAGQTWTNLTDGKTDISSVGAIAVARSDPNMIYVGTGESQLREDLTFGTGMYRSTDGGETWQHLGLAGTQQIGALAIDPTDANRVYVAAMGHAFGPNAERGLYRTTDGGKTWTKVLFLNDSTGANDISIDPANPRVLFVSMYKFQRTPWGMNAGGGRSGLWKSIDGGDTWTELTFNPGIPAKPLGKIGVAVSPANPRRVYAVIEAPDSSGGVFRSDNGGDTWTRTNGDQTWAVRPWYYSMITADPLDENTVYAMNLSVHRSIDGGRTFSRLRVPHGDTHVMWIDPKDPRRMINGNDGGATISLDGGATWSSVLNQPTAQFYHVTTDNQWPYRILGAQQDNSTVSVASRSDYGAIGERDYFPIAGCENATIAVDPRDPNVTYGGCYTGMLMRNDRARMQDRDISAWLYNYDGLAAGKVPYRFQWTFPVLISPHDPNTIYIGSQFVHRSRNEGASWDIISPDLTRHDPKTLEESGGPIHFDMTGTEWYATIYALAESPKAKGVLWAGSDDGLIHLTRDGGASWQNVTPPGYGSFTRTAQIEASPHDAAVAYVAANRYQQDDLTPAFWKTADYGKTWTLITNGIPAPSVARTLREDPVRRGLLYAGTETGAFVSFDDGAHWETLQLNLPRVSVRDLQVHGNDLIAATHGRGFWVIDDISLLRSLADSITAKPAHLFAPAPAIRWFSGGGRSLTAGQNPVGGAYIDYYLKAAPTQALTLEFLDANGRRIRTYSSAAPDTSKPKTALDSLARRTRERLRDSVIYPPADSIVQARPGTNRFVWNLRYPGAKEMSNTVLDEGTLDGPVAPPGTYTVRLIAGADTLRRTFDVVMDPRVKTPVADITAQFDAAIRIRDRINDLADAAHRAEDFQAQLDARKRAASNEPFAKQVTDAVTPVRGKLEAVRTELYEVGCHVDECTLDQPIKLYNMLLSLNAQVQTGDYAPTKQHGGVYDELAGKLGVELKRLQEIEDKDLAELNTLLQSLGVPPVFIPPRLKVAM